MLLFDDTCPCYLFVLNLPQDLILGLLELGFPFIFLRTLLVHPLEVMVSHCNSLLLPAHVLREVQVGLRYLCVLPFVAKWQCVRAANNHRLGEYVLASFNFGHLYTIFNMLAERFVISNFCIIVTWVWLVPIVLVRLSHSVARCKTVKLPSE